MARDLGKLEDDMGSIETLRGKRGAGKPARMVPPMAAKRPMANPADAGIFTADKGIQPPSPDEGPTMDRGMPPRRPMGGAGMGMKKGGCVKKMASGGYAKGGSASKRADGIAQRGKTKGKMV